MKPKTKIQIELDNALQQPDFYLLTDAQLQNMRDKWENVHQDRDCIIASIEDRYNGLNIKKVYKVRSFGRNHSVFEYHLCVVRATRGEEVATASRFRGMGFYIDSFSYYSDITVKYNDNDACNYYLRGAFPVSNKRKIIYPYDVKRAISGNYVVYRSTMVEMINQSRYKAFVDFIANIRKPLSKPLYTALRICIRNNYTIEDDNIWEYYRYVNLCHRNGLDLYNKVISCPEDLHEALSRVIHIDDKRKQRNIEQREIRQVNRHLKECKALEEGYLKSKGKYLSIVISDNDFDIHVLQSVKEFLEEGTAMHHCVYVNKYYDKASLLIFSVRDKNGNRIATIEFDLKMMKVLQCNGSHNSKPKEYNHIIDLMKSNTGLIQKAKRKKAT